MATFEGFQLLGKFSIILVFFFVWSIFYALLAKVKPFGDQKNIYALISFVVAILFVTVEPIVELFSYLVPWLLIILIFILLVMVLVMSLGVKQKSITGWIGGSEGSFILWILVILCVIIFLIGFGKIFGQKLLNEGTDDIEINETTGSKSVATGSYQKNLMNTLFHPRILGLILISLISFLLIKMISTPAS